MREKIVPLLQQRVKVRLRGVNASTNDLRSSVHVLLVIPAKAGIQAILQPRHHPRPNPPPLSREREKKMRGLFRGE
jgi:hypothetical protein